MKNVTLTLANETHTNILLPLVRDYHKFENIKMSDTSRTKAFAPLLLKESPFGRIWLIKLDEIVVGYIAVCFGYSIEFCGRDAFIDEFFLKEKLRQQGIGTKVIELVKNHAVSFNIVALHLEVARNNQKAEEFYTKSGFSRRERYNLMACSLENLV